MDISRYEGKEHKVSGSTVNYLINVNDPAFTGKNMSFIKLDRVSELVLPVDKKQIMLGRIINSEDLKIVREKLGFGN